MTDRIDKFLNKLSAKQKKEMDEIIDRILKKDFKGMDKQKIQGEKDVYRVRKASFRIIFRVLEDDVELLSVTRRSDTTYNMIWV